MHNFYRFISLVILFLAFSCQHTLNREVASNKEIKRNLKNSTIEFRNESLHRAEIFLKSYDPEKVKDINLVSELIEACGKNFDYIKAPVTFGYTENNNYTPLSYKWPTVTCKYHPDTERKMSGGSSKFLCDFPSEKAADGLSTKKIKYANYPNDPLRSEVIETVISFNLSKLMGMPTNIYCPAEIDCQNCPSSTPWNSEHASVPAGKHMYHIQYAIIEETLFGDAISIPNPNAPVGVEWEEFKNVKAATEEKKKQMLIEREALMLWISFIQHTDAAGFNNRLSCKKTEKDENKNLTCTEPYLYLHDHGHAFYRHLNFSKWSGERVFQPNAPGSGCRTSMRKGFLPEQSPMKGIILEAEISSEARDIIYNRLTKITDDQWTTLFYLARAEEASGVTAGLWLKAIKKKIAEVKAANCLPFDMKKSVLAQ